MVNLNRLHSSTVVEDIYVQRGNSLKLMPSNAWCPMLKLKLSAVFNGQQRWRRFEIISILPCVPIVPT